MIKLIIVILIIICLIVFFVRRMDSFGNCNGPLLEHDTMESFDRRVSYIDNLQLNNLVGENPFGSYSQTGGEGMFINGGKIHNDIPDYGNWIDLNPGYGWKVEKLDTTYNSITVGIDALVSALIYARSLFTFKYRILHLDGDGQIKTSQESDIFTVTGDGSKCTFNATFDNIEEGDIFECLFIPETSLIAHACMYNYIGSVYVTIQNI